MVRLPRWVHLNGHWEIGLHSIAYYAMEHNPTPRRADILHDRG